MKNGDIAMYRAKSLGRGNFQFYSPDMNSNSVLKQELATALHHALENNEISTHFQPIIDAKT